VARSSRVPAPDAFGDAFAVFEAEVSASASPVAPVARLVRVADDDVRAASRKGA
jgi:hypothetical protein